MTSSLSVNACLASICTNTVLVTLQGLCILNFFHCCIAIPAFGHVLCTISWHFMSSMFRCALWLLLSHLDILVTHADIHCSVARPGKPSAFHPSTYKPHFLSQPFLQMLFADAVVTCSLKLHHLSHQRTNQYTQQVSFINTTICTVRDINVCPACHAEAPCAAQCTKQVYPTMEDFTSCTECTSKKENIPYSTQENAGIEVVLTLHYSRRSQLLGAAQPTMVNAFVDLLQDRGIKVHR